MDAGPTVVTDVLLDLTQSLPRSRLVDWHLDGPLPISDHHRSQTAELGVDLTGREERGREGEREEERGRGERGREGERRGGREGAEQHTLCSLNRTPNDSCTTCSNIKTSFPHTFKQKQSPKV